MDTRLNSLHQRTYGLRTLGMGLGALPAAVVFVEINAAWPAWAWLIAGCALWPHLAFLLAQRSRDPLRAELRNFLIDSVIATSLVPLMHFNVLPSAVLIAVVIADKINTGIRGLWLRSLPGMVIGLVLAGLCTGYAWQPQTSMAVLLASLPILVIHTLAVSVTSYRLVRRVQKQNAQLEQVSRTDSLTGLATRGHWMTQAEALLRRHHEQGAVASLLLIDIDEFKDINDCHGHPAGDDVLRDIAGCLRTESPEGSLAGRLGGDEFAVALPLPLTEAEFVAERVRMAVEALRFEHTPSLRCSISLGVAAPPQGDTDLRSWLDAADRNLYAAKRGGRDRVVAREVVF